MADSLFWLKMDKSEINNKNREVDFSFHKSERLCSKKIIEKLFSEGKSIFVFPLKFVYLETSLPAGYPVQVAFSVAKKTFKKAVQRNLIKRRMREAYRLKKPKFYDALGENQIAVFIIFTGKVVPEYKQIEISLEKGMKKLISEFRAS